MKDLFGPLEARPNLGQGNEIGKTDLERITDIKVSSGRQSLSKRKHELAVEDSNKGQMLRPVKRKKKDAPFSFGA